MLGGVPRSCLNQHWLSCNLKNVGWYCMCGVPQGRHCPSWTLSLVELCDSPMNWVSCTFGRGSLLFQNFSELHLHRLTGSVNRCVWQMWCGIAFGVLNRASALLDVVLPFLGFSRQFFTASSSPCVCFRLDLIILVIQSSSTSDTIIKKNCETSLNPQSALHVSEY